MRSSVKSDGQKSPLRRRPVSLSDYLDADNGDSAAEFQRLTASDHQPDTIHRDGQHAGETSSNSGTSNGNEADSARRRGPHTRET